MSVSRSLRLPFKPSFAVALAASVFSVTQVASASESFPGAIQDYLNKTRKAGAPEVECAVPCVLCHTDPKGTAATVRGEGFTTNLLESGTVMPDTPASLAPALAVLEANLDCPSNPGKPCDADKDGVPDVAELRASLDPDGNRDFDECLKYGCGATVAPATQKRAELSVLWVLGALGALSVMRRRRG